MPNKAIVADIEAIIHRSVGYPIEEMSRLIKAGNDSVEELKGALLAGLAEEHPATLPLTVALGETRSLAAMALLAEMLKLDCGEVLQDAAAEALGKLGEPAIPTLRKIIAEEFVEGREVECSVLGNDNPIASVPGEIIPKHSFYSYEAKYLDPEGADLKIPAD